MKSHGPPTPDSSRSRTSQSALKPLSATEIKHRAKAEAQAEDLSKSIGRPKSNPRLLKPLANNNINVSEQLANGVSVMGRCKEVKSMMKSINKEIGKAAREMEKGFYVKQDIMSDINDAFTSVKTDAELQLLASKRSSVKKTLFAQPA